MTKPESGNITRFALLGLCDAVNSAGMSRPPKPPAERLLPVTVHLNAESRELLDQHATARGLSRGQLIASVLKRLTFPARKGSQ